MGDTPVFSRYHSGYLLQAVLLQISTDHTYNFTREKQDAANKNNSKRRVSLKLNMYAVIFSRCGCKELREGSELWLTKT